VLNRLFGVTLWCKTLVLRKDKVTHCSNDQFSVSEIYITITDTFVMVTVNERLSGDMLH